MKLSVQHYAFEKKIFYTPPKKNSVNGFNIQFDTDEELITIR